MEDTITTTYYLCDEFLKAIGHHDDPQVRHMSTAEVMTIPLVACAFFSGNIEASRSFLDESTDTYQRRSQRVASTDGCTP